MQSIVVGAVQMNALCGRTAENLERHVALARKAARRGAELVCFPELSVTGHYVDGAAWKEAQAVPGGPACRRLERLAHDLEIFVSAGLAERDRGACYNTQVLVGPQGYIGKYRKTHASGDEYFHYRMGAAFPVFDIGKCTVGILICYDIAFPEVSRILAVQGAEVLLAPHASRCGPKTVRQERGAIEYQKGYFEMAGWARSRDNGVYLVMNNQAGDAGKHVGIDAVHGGGVVITGPKGDVVARSRTRRFVEEIVVAELDGDAFTECRARRCHPLQTRRPEIYGALAEPT